MLCLARRPALLRAQLASLQIRGFADIRTVDRDIAVVGGGLTGLTAAYYLAKMLPPSARITLYEGSNRLGGWIQTDKVPVNVNGTRGVVNFERGPRSLSSLKGNTWRYDDLVLYDLLLDLGLEASFPKDLPRYIYYPDHLVKMPPDASILECVSEPLFRECIWSILGGIKSYALGNHVNRPPSDDMSVSAWLELVTGSRSLGDNLASAMIHGIYGGDIDRLSVQSVLDRQFQNLHAGPIQPNQRRVPQPELSFFRNILERNNMVSNMANAPKGSLIHFGAQGVESLPRALENALTGQHNVTIQRNSPVAQISANKRDKKIQVVANNQPRSHDWVISTTSNQELVKSTGNSLLSLAAIESVSIMAVNLWYPIENLKPPSFGYLIPRTVPAEQNPERALGVFFDSDVITERGPDEPPGTKLFVLMGGHYYNGREPPGEEEAIRQAKAVVERHLGIPQSTPCHALARLNQNCIPQHNVGHRKTLQHADQQLHQEFDGRLTVANGAYGRIGVMGALRNGYDAAQIALRGHPSSGLADFIGQHKMYSIRQEDIPCRQTKSQS